MIVDQSVEVSRWKCFLHRWVRKALLRVAIWALALVAARALAVLIFGWQSNETQIVGYGTVGVAAMVIHSIIEEGRDLRRYGPLMAMDDAVRDRVEASWRPRMWLRLLVVAVVSAVVFWLHGGFDYSTPWFVFQNMNIGLVLSGLVRLLFRIWKQRGFNRRLQAR